MHILCQLYRKLKLIILPKFYVILKMLFFVLKYVSFNTIVIYRYLILALNLEYKDDIALVKLVKPAPLNNYVSYGCLPSQDDVFMAGQMCTVAGWGLTANGENQQ